MVSKVPIKRKTSTFDRFMDDRAKATEDLVLRAAKSVDASKYQNVTDYCKALAANATQLREVEAKNPESVFNKTKPRNFSHVTLLRNDVYRKIVDEIFNSSRSNIIEAVPSGEDLEVLKARNAGLTAQITLLKSKIASMDARNNSGEDTGHLEYQEAGELVDKLNARIFLLLKIYRLLRTGLRGAIKYREVPEGGHEPGLWVPYVHVATLDELEMLRLAELELPTEMRNELRKIERSS